MFAYLKGTLVSAVGTMVVLDVGGVGYEMQVSLTSLQQLPAPGKDAKLFTYLAVREDGVSLFGFAKQEEKLMFLQLTSISGIGPKAAMSILSGMNLSSLALAIISGDTKAISKIKGVGKKTAERIVLELKEKLAKESDTDLASFMPIVGADRQEELGIFGDAVQALKTLGIPHAEAHKAVSKVQNATTLEELIAQALKQLG